MKKVITICMTLALIFALAVPACADIDLSGLSYDELVALKDQINLAIWQSEEWQEVEVPHGIWEVGADIPAGHWTITAGDGCNLWLYIGGRPNKTYTELENWDSWLHMRSKTHKYFDPSSDIDSLDVVLTDGTFLCIDEGSVIFTPYAGKPSLGFK